MKKGYVQSFGTAEELEQIIKNMKLKGIEAKNIVINETFDTFAMKLVKGDQLMIYSLSTFKTLTELLYKVAELAKKGISIESISEPWFVVNEELSDLLYGINSIGKTLRSSSTRKGQTIAKANGKILGRPVGTTKIDEKVKAVVKLRKNSTISVTKACAIKGCNPRTYYRYMEKLQA